MGAFQEFSTHFGFSQAAQGLGVVPTFASNIKPLSASVALIQKPINWVAV